MFFFSFCYSYYSDTHLTTTTSFLSYTHPEQRTRHGREVYPAPTKLDGSFHELVLLVTFTDPLAKRGETHKQKWPGLALRPQ